MRVTNIMVIKNCPLIVFAEFKLCQLIFVTVQYYSITLLSK